jgi:hypothetical protein
LNLPNSSDGVVVSKSVKPQAKEKVDHMSDSESAMRDRIFRAVAPKDSPPIAARLLLVLVVLGAHTARAQEVTDDGRVGIILAHPLIVDDFSGAPYFWFDDQTGGVRTYRVSFPNVIYHARPWLQGWGGL